VYPLVFDQQLACISFLPIRLRAFFLYRQVAGLLLPCAPNRLALEPFVLPFVLCIIQGAGLPAPRRSGSASERGCQHRGRCQRCLPTALLRE
jgi:hypothetical protein